MISREEKNKIYVDEIKREKNIKISKIVFKILSIIMAIFLIIFLYVYFVGPKGLETHEYVIKNSDIPISFNGIKILHFADLLYGSTINKENMKKISDEIKLINPDIVFFTGNIISENYETNEDDINYLNSFFKDISYTIGKYAVPGDGDSSSFNLILENTNFTILNNEVISLYHEKNKITLIGINDKEEKEIKNSQDYTITLINNYDNYQKYNITSNIVLSGHNLGGEIKIFNLPLIGKDKYLGSFYEDNNTKIYISSGLGTKHHMRFMNKPSLNVYRLYNN